jgi:hypothetical protein
MEFLALVYLFIIVPLLSTKSEGAVNKTNVIKVGLEKFLSCKISKNIFILRLDLFQLSLHHQTMKI